MLLTRVEWCLLQNSTPPPLGLCFSSHLSELSLSSSKSRQQEGEGQEPKRGSTLGPWEICSHLHPVKLWMSGCNQYCCVVLLCWTRASEPACAFRFSQTRLEYHSLMWKCWGSEQSRKNSLEFSPKRWVYLSTGIGPMGRRSTPGVVMGDWLYTFKLGEGLG